MPSKYRAGQRPGDFRRPGLAFLTAAIQDAVLAFDDLDGKIFEVEFLPAADGGQLGLVDAGAQGKIDGGSGANDLRSKALGDERNVADVIGVTMAGKNVVAPVDHAEHSRFVGLPL